MQIEGKIFWLVGASAGIGKALAYRLAEEGTKVAISARSEDDLNAMAEDIGEACLPVPLDVTDPKTIAKARDHIFKQWDHIDAMVYLAGAYDPMSTKEMELEKVETFMDINVNGCLRVIDSIMPHFRDHNQGAVIITGSVAGYIGLPKAAGYGMSKAALNYLAEEMRIDYADTGIEVRLISPGFVKTRLTDKNDFKMPARITPEKAADYIVKGLKGNRFEIHFPKRFTFFMKLLRFLPYPLYFWLTRHC